MVNIHEILKLTFSTSKFTIFFSYFKTNYKKLASDFLLKCKVFVVTAVYNFNVWLV